MNQTTDHAQIVVNPFVILGGVLVVAALLHWLLPLPLSLPWSMAPGTRLPLVRFS